MSHKIRVVINTDYLLLKSGLGRNGEELAWYLHNTGKFEVIYYACGMPWSHPDYARFPFKVVGALPNDRAEAERINSGDPKYARDCAYGAYYIDRVISEFKPDIYITSNDSWGSETFFNKPWWNKINVVPHITLDSLPFLPIQVDYLKKTKNFLVWADFAKEEAERLGFKHVQVISGIINDSKFFPLSKKEKLNDRKKFNIPEDAFVAGFVFRNQIRKEVGALIEGYSKFKKRYNTSGRKTYLLLHTHFSEPGGWDIPRFIEEHGVDKNEVLTTYVCKNCKEIEIRPFNGQDTDCRFCSAHRSQITCNIGFGCSEEDLNRVYNVMDAYVHLANAAGLEIPQIEAMYAGLPLATMDYAACSMFARLPFVYTVDHEWGVQHGSQFKRAIPSADSVAAALYYFYTLIPESLLEIQTESRKWALSRFSPSVVCKQWEDYLLNLPNVEWDYNFNVEQKNPNYSNPNISDDAAWVKDIYKNILKMEVNDQDEGFNHWIKSLKNGMPREAIYKYFIEEAHKENVKNKPVTLENFIDADDKKRVLVILPESIGDIFMATSLFKSIRERYPAPEWKFYFSCNQQYHSLLDGNSYVDKVIPYSQQMDNLLLLEGSGGHKGFFDVVYPLHFGTQRLLDYVHNGVDKHGLM